MFKNKIVIIGNGFDLAHGYKTSFKDFAENKNCTDFKNFICDLYDANIANNKDKWTDFERIIQDSTMKICASNDNINKLYKNSESKDWNEFTKKIDDRFTLLSNEIMDYLNRIEKENHEFKVKNSIKKYLDENSYIINFNYTNFAERYTKNIFYIHGSLKEKDIILGYDRHVDSENSEPCVMEPNLMKRNKSFMRQALNYKRYLRTKELSEFKINELGIKYLNYIANCEGNASGIIPAFNGHYYTSFTKTPNYDKQIPINIQFDDIRTIIIIGHSLLSDEKLITESIINNCRYLKHFILFVYNNENCQEIKNKKSLLKKACPKAKIILKKY